MILSCITCEWVIQIIWRYLDLWGFTQITWPFYNYFVFILLLLCFNIRVIFIVSVSLSNSLYMLLLWVLLLFLQKENIYFLALFMEIYWYERDFPFHPHIKGRFRCTSHPSHFGPLTPRRFSIITSSSRAQNCWIVIRQ